jgi:hypothetical protein
MPNLNLFGDDETRRMAETVRHSEQLRRDAAPRLRRYPHPTDNAGGGTREVVVIGIADLDADSVTVLVLANDEEGHLFVPPDSEPVVYKTWHPSTAGDFIDDVWPGGEFDSDVVVHPAFNVGALWKVLPLRVLGMEPFPMGEEFSDCGRLHG